MKYVLLMLLFTTPPSEIATKDKGKANDHRAWALQSTTSVELSTKAYCEQIAKNMALGIDATATMTVRMYCIPKDEETLKQDNPNIFKQAARPDRRAPASVDNGVTKKIDQSQISRAIRLN